MDFQHDPDQAELSRLLVAADASIDPHRLVKFCCERAGSDGLGVSLLVPIEVDAQAPHNNTAAVEDLLRRTAGLFDAAGLRLEDVNISDEDADTVGELVRSGGFDALFVCATHEKASSPVLTLAAQLARLHGLAVIRSGPEVGNDSWLRRLVDPLLHWSRG